MKNEIIVKELRETIIRLEGAAKILERTPEVLAYRKIQGAKDKVQDLWGKLYKENDEDSEELVNELKKTIKND